jgi:phospholipid N-methyltransferase
MNDVNIRTEMHDPTILKHYITGNQKTIVEFGAGTGFFSKSIAKFNKNYMIISIDRDISSLRHLRMDVYANINAVNGTDTSFIKGNTVDVVLLANVFHDIVYENRIYLIEQIKNILKHDGKIIIIDWKPINSEYGPPLRIRLSPDREVEIMRQSGYLFIESKIISETHYLLLFKNNL